MFSFFSPSNIFVYLNKIIEFLNSIIFIVLVVALTFALVFSPPDYVQGDAVRIMYVHVPSAWISLAIFSIMTFSYIINYIFRIKNLLIINYSIAPLGLLFTALAIITGSVWGNYLGNVVGLGCKTDFNDFFNVFLHSINFIFKIFK